MVDLNQIYRLKHQTCGGLRQYLKVIKLTDKAVFVHFMKTLTEWHKAEHGQYKYEQLGLDRGDGERVLNTYWDRVRSYEDGGDGKA